MINEIKRMQQLAGIQLNELEISRVINKSDLLDWTNLVTYLENNFELPSYICDKYDSNSQEIIDNNMSEFLENHLQNYLGKYPKELFKDFMEYCNDY